MSSLALGDCLFSAFRPYSAAGTVIPATTAYNFLPSIAAFTEAMNNAALSQSVSPIDILTATSSPSSSLLPVVSAANIASSAAVGVTKTPPINHASHANKHSPPLHQPQMSKKRQRTTFTPQQASTLEREYLNDQYMPRQRRQLIAESLNLNESQVKTWFQNRRAKEKRTDKAHQANRSSTSPQSESLAATTTENLQPPAASPTPVPTPNYAMILQTMQLSQKLQANPNPAVLPPF